MHLIGHLFGTSAATITWWQMAVRAVLVFSYLLLLLRIGGRRVFGRFTNFDIVVAILLGSTLSRTLTANAALGPTMAASAVLVFLHSLVARVAFMRRGIAWLVEGREEVLVRDGVLQEDAMQHAAIKEADLVEALRSSQGTEDLSQVRVARLERNGHISFVRR